MDSSSSKQNYVQQQPQPQIIYVQNKPSSGTAAVLSFFIPGLGQIYKGRLGAGILWGIATAIGYFPFIVPGLILHFFCILSAIDD